MSDAEESGRNELQPLKPDFSCMGTKITKVTPLEGVIAETAGAFTLYITEMLKIPVSTEKATQSGRSLMLLIPMPNPIEWAAIMAAAMIPLKLQLSSFWLLLSEW